MNSEELEQSLRTEFESYLKEVLADMKQEVSEYQEKIESEFEKQRAQISGVFEEFSKKIGEDKEVDVSFTESVTEHLKLARDEGAKITAAAIAEAEDMREDEEPSANFSDIRDAINEISSKDSQSEILKSLVHHASQYTTRGAFFIIKNKHLVGWKVFGTDQHESPNVVKEIYFPVSSNTSLTESVESLATVASSYGIHEDDSLFLDKLGFGEPTGMYSIPLVVRGRGVAVLYADRGNDDGAVNVEALESLIRVAGLTVDVVASTSGLTKKASDDENIADDEHVSDEESANADAERVGGEPAQEFESTDEFKAYTPPEVESGFEATRAAPANDFQPVSQEIETDAPVTNESENVAWTDPAEAAAPEYDASSFAPSVESEKSYEIETPAEPEQTVEYTSDPPEFGSIGVPTAPVEEYSTPEVEAAPEIEASPEVDSSYQDDSYQIDAPESAAPAPEFETQSETTGFETTQFNTAEVSTPSVETPAEPVSGFEAVPEVDSFEPTVESPVEDVAEEVAEEVVASTPASDPSPAPARSRFGDRNVDLPIEVEEDERRHHNDARRFARLLVSEIKLYNEQKVKEGRESADLYERLREAIDRSREMYEKRVQPPVAAKFDYFNYELVNTLAEGDEGKLGNGYPGASI